MTYCMYCTKKIPRANLNHTREIVCDECVQKMIPQPKVPPQGSESRSKPRKVRSVGGIKGNMP